MQGIGLRGEGEAKSGSSTDRRISLYVSRHLSQLGRKRMELIRLGVCEMVFAVCCCLTDPFFALRESFFLSGLLPSALRAPRDRSEEKVVEGSFFFNTLRARPTGFHRFAGTA